MAHNERREQENIISHDHYFIENYPAEAYFAVLIIYSHTLAEVSTTHKQQMDGYGAPPPRVARGTNRAAAAAA
jgi:hypothetical protein